MKIFYLYGQQKTILKFRTPLPPGLDPWFSRAEPWIDQKAQMKGSQTRRANLQMIVILLSQIT